MFSPFIPAAIITITAAATALVVIINVVVLRVCDELLLPLLVARCGVGITLEGFLEGRVEEVLTAVVLGVASERCERIIRVLLVVVHVVQDRRVRGRLQLLLL